MRGRDNEMCVKLLSTLSYISVLNVSESEVYEIGNTSINLRRC